MYTINQNALAEAFNQLAEENALNEFTATKAVTEFLKNAGFSAKMVKVKQTEALPLVESEKKMVGTLQRPIMALARHGGQIQSEQAKTRLSTLEKLAQANCEYQITHNKLLQLSAEVNDAPDNTVQEVDIQVAQAQASLFIHHYGIPMILLTAENRRASLITRTYAQVLAGWLGKTIMMIETNALTCANTLPISELDFYHPAVKTALTTGKLEAGEESWTAMFGKAEVTRITQGIEAYRAIGSVLKQNNFMLMGHSSTQNTQLAGWPERLGNCEILRLRNDHGDAAKLGLLVEPAVQEK